MMDNPETHEKQTDSFSQLETTNCNKLMRFICLYQNSCLVVNVVLIEVTFSIVGLNDSSDTSVQSDVSFGISGVHQEM